MKQLPFLLPSAAATRNPRRPAIIVPVQATDPAELHRQCSRVAGTGVVDAIEWRIDALPLASHGAEAVLSLADSVRSVGLPVLITLRTGFEGGNAEVSESEYAEILSRTIRGIDPAGENQGPVHGVAADTSAKEGAGIPFAIDIEIDRSASGTLIALAHERGIPVVASHHNFEATDSVRTLVGKFDSMASAGADVAKIAMMPHGPGDVADLLRSTAEADARLDCPVLGISMGELGRTSRIMGADFGSCASFAQLGEASAPGQIDVVRLAQLFDLVYGGSGRS